jgi:hypothetical protein
VETLNVTTAQVVLALASGAVGAIIAQLLAIWHNRVLENERSASALQLEADRKAFMQQLENERNAFAKQLETDREAFTQHKHSLHTLRIRLFADLMGHRNWVTGEGFSTALNSAMGLFFDDEKVIRSIRELVHSKAVDKDSRLVAVFRSIAANLNIANDTFTDNDFLTAFNVRDHGWLLRLHPATFNGAPQVNLEAISDAGGGIPNVLARMDAPAVEAFIAQLRQALQVAQRQQ